MCIDWENIIYSLQVVFFELVFISCDYTVWDFLIVEEFCT